MNNKSILLYDSISKKKIEFIPDDPTNVKMYVCGPTVYDSPHIGHARTYVSFDIIRKILENYFEYNVTFVMNITDIDDKIIIRSKEKNLDPIQLSQIYEKEFFDDMDKLKVKRPDFITRVTEHIPQIINFIQKLENNGLTYVSNGSVYFDLKKYKKIFKYNVLRLSGIEQHLIDTTVKSIISTEKKSLDDFALWKNVVNKDELKFHSPWGEGRPGWHIECSVMSTHIFGSKLDIHGGGIDLMFPHHENEIAQCQGYFNDTWVKYFLHTGHLNIDGRKMSKSLKNFLTISEIINNYSGITIRILFLQHHWNSPMNYSEEQLKRADVTRKKIFNFISTAESIITQQKLNNINNFQKSNPYIRSMTSADKELYAVLLNTKQIIDKHFRDNINFSDAFLEITNLITNVNTVISDLSTDILYNILTYIKKILDIFGIIEDHQIQDELSEKFANILNNFRMQIRQSLRNKATFKELFTICDKIRDEVKTVGYQIEDTKDHSIIRKIN